MALKLFLADITGRKEPRRCKHAATRTNYLVRIYWGYTDHAFCHRLQAVVERFSTTLRRLSASDNIIKTAGVAGYAQSVLVPELAMSLVKEDMGVDDDSARQIMRESIDLGQKLNPALDDEVPVPAEDEEL
jgi:hypothetical protein